MDMELIAKKKKKLKSNIIIQYIFFLFFLLFYFLLLPYLYYVMVGDNTGLDYIGQAIGIALILKFLLYIFTFVVFIINPIRILITYKKIFKEIISNKKRRFCKFLVVLPILFAALIILEIPISNLIFHLQYDTGKGSYKVEYSDYKSASDFYEELDKRNLTYNSNTIKLKNRLNSDHDCVNYIHHDNGKMFSQKCYEESTIMGIGDEEFFDNISHKSIGKEYSYKYPVYIYNAILTLPSKNEKMQYAALGRYSYNSDDYGDYRAKFEDYYIECKILYVDGNIYAIIGEGEAFDVNNNMEKVGDEMFNYNYPYNMIISETDNITTYVDDKYYPYGAIENSASSFEMKPNTKTLYVSNYPVRKVDRVDLKTINKIAEELQNTVLKESIEKHFNE